MINNQIAIIYDIKCIQPLFSFVFSSSTKKRLLLCEIIRGQLNTSVIKVRAIFSI